MSVHTDNFGDIGDNTVLCPSCRTANPRVCGIKVFVAADCPICMERISPLVALPCGHCVCVDDFKRLGHDYPAQAPNLPRAAPLPQPRAAPSPTPFDTELSPTLGPSAGMVPPPMQATGRWRSGVLWSLNRLWAGRWSYGSSPPHSPTRRGGSPTHGGSMLHSSRDPAAIPERRLPLPSGSATMSPGEALAAWTQERQQNDMVVRLIRTHGRSYQEGEVCDRRIQPSPLSPISRDSP